MLLSLSIQNIVLIESLSLTFKKGLTTFTGETGAGKSIILDSLDLVLGGRGSANFIRAGQERAVITAEFDASNLPIDVTAYLEEQGISLEDSSLYLKRMISRDGKSKAFINDQPVSVQTLRYVGERLVEVSGQFEHHLLLEASHHRALVDAYGDHHELLKRVAAAYTHWQELSEVLVAKENTLSATKQQEDYLRHILKELDHLNPQSTEEESLYQRRTLLANAEKIREGVETAWGSLEGEPGARLLLSQALRALEKLPEGVPESIGNALNSLRSALAEVESASHDLQSLSELSGNSPEDLQKVEDRLFALRDLARKHQIEVAALPNFRERIVQQLRDLGQGEESLEGLRKEQAAARQYYEEAAKKLSQQRLKTAKKLDQKIMAELPPLKLEAAEFLTEITALSESEWGVHGIDQVFFKARTNKGSALGPLPKIASGGELSRFLLALKVVMAETSLIPTLVFDEVDSGVGGSTANAVGERLAEIARKTQVLVVTHSPQVAARGDHHFLVEKKGKDTNTETSVVPLADEARREEIARMLSGAIITDQAREAARMLMVG